MTHCAPPPPISRFAPRGTGVNIYLQFLEEEEKPLIFRLFRQAFGANTISGICTVQCTPDSPLPPHCPRRDTFSHRNPSIEEVILVCHCRGVDTHARMAALSQSFTVSASPGAGNHLVFWS